MAGSRERQIDTTTTFQISREWREKWFSRKPINISYLLCQIIEHYIEKENDKVKVIIRRVRNRNSVRIHLTKMIEELNGIEREIPRNMSSLKIPSSIELIRKAFPDFGILNNAEGPIQIDNSVETVLDRFDYNEELETFIQDPNIYADTISNNALELIKNALHSFRIYTAKPNTTDRQLIKSAVKVFQIEYIGRSDRDYSGNINWITVILMNQALREEWQRYPYCEKVNPVTNERRYFIRLGVRPVEFQYTQEENEWRELRIPRLLNNQEQERTVREAGCAITFVTNMAHTHRARLIARGRLEESTQEITPRTIALNENSPPAAPVYFTGTGRIFWSEPIRTMLQSLLRRQPSDNFPDFSTNFNNMSSSRQYYIAIRVFINGAFGTRPENGFTGEHWVGVKELVTFPAETIITIAPPDGVTGIAATEHLDTDTMFFRISPTSENDLNSGVPVGGGFHNRGARRWQFIQNDIYVPQSEVTDYRIFQIPQNQ